MTRLRVLLASLSLIVLSCLAHGQDEPTCATLYLPNQEVRVHDLPSATAASKDATAVLAAALEVTLHDKAVCCGKDSALEAALLSDPRSLKELSDKLQGRHLLSDGRPIIMTAEYVPRASITPGLLVGVLLNQHAPLVEWKSHVYILYGVVFDETRCYGTAKDYSIHKLLLMDPRFSAARREVVFNRETDDWAKVEGMLTPMVESQ